MYVCICTNINSKTVENAIREKGCRTVEDVFQCLGKTPECRKCLTFMNDLIATLDDDE